MAFILTVPFTIAAYFSWTEIGDRTLALRLINNIE
jgi:hypothetical protein